MYSRAFGNPDTADTDNRFYPPTERYTEEETPPPATECAVRQERKRGFSLGRLFSDINTEDLLLIAIAALLLLDGDPDNDILIIALAFLFFF